MNPAKGPNTPVLLTLVLLWLILIGYLTALYFQRRVAEGPPPPQPVVRVIDRHLLADFDRNGYYEPFLIKGIIYHPPDTFDPAILHRDLSYLHRMNANVIQLSILRSGKRLTEPEMHRILDLADAYGLKVIPVFAMPTEESRCQEGQRVMVHADFIDPATRHQLLDEFVGLVTSFRSHPAVLFWAIGQGNNAHLDALNREQWLAFYSLIDEMAAAAHLIEGPLFHPVALINHEIDSIGHLSLGTHDVDLKNLDIWGVISFRGDSFGRLFSDYSRRSQKPLWIAGFGVDAFYAPDHHQPTVGREDPETPGLWLGNLWTEILQNRPVVIGGTIKELKDRALNEQEDPGVGPRDFDCDGRIDWNPVTPDQYYHSGWWGLMRVNTETDGSKTLSPRLGYHVMREYFSCPMHERVHYTGPLNHRSCDGTAACCTDLNQRAQNGRCVFVCQH